MIKSAYIGLISVLGSLSLGSSAAYSQTAAEFCVQASPLAERAECRRDYLYGLNLSVKYMRHHGLLSDDGVEIGQLLSSIFSWRSFIYGRKTPGWVVSICSDAGEVAGMIDYRKTWVCIMDNDPDAALMEAI